MAIAIRSLTVLLIGLIFGLAWGHGATHADQADTDPLILDNVAKQRQLNDKGVPIGKSYSSRFIRAVETARLVGGKEPQVTFDVSEGGWW